MNNDLRIKVASQITTQGQDDGEWQYALQTADELITLIRTATLAEVKELAEHEKVGANENDGEGDRYYDKALTDLIRAIATKGRKL